MSDLSGRRAAGATAGVFAGNLASVSTFPEDLGDKLFDIILWIKSAKTWHGLGIGEIPGVLRQSNEVADCRIRCPSATKCRMLER